MTRKYRAAALTVAILAAVLAASSPAAGQWSSQWYDRSHTQETDGTWTHVVRWQDYLKTT